jgi:RHS repeat-associated protein
VTNHIGQIHERLEYTPYGELWIDWRSADAPEDGTPFRFTGKELDPETGLYYFGARYLDPKTSRWLSGDPAVGDYLPSAPVNDEARKRNGNLPGQGGVFNYVNLHVYHYAGNNPVKYTDPDGRVDLRSIGGFFMKLILKPTPVGDAGNAESSRSLYNQQFQTEREKDNAYKRIIGAGGILPGWFGRAATVFAIVADAGWDESVVIYRDRTGFIAGAEQEISRIDELLEGLPASSNERNFLEEQKGLLRREIDENKKADEKLNREISFHYSGQVPDRRSAEPRGNPVDYQRHIEDL